jgi:hypothetical protein
LFHTCSRRRPGGDYILESANMVRISRQVDNQPQRNKIAREVTPAMIAAGLKALWGSGEVEYETPSQERVVRAIYKAMEAARAAGHKDQMR